MTRLALQWGFVPLTISLLYHGANHNYRSMNAKSSSQPAREAMIGNGISMDERWNDQCLLSVSTVALMVILVQQACQIVEATSSTQWHQCLHPWFSIPLEWLPPAFRKTLFLVLYAGPPIFPGISVCCIIIANEHRPRHRVSPFLIFHVLVLKVFRSSIRICKMDRISWHKSIMSRYKNISTVVWKARARRSSAKWVV